MKLSARKRIQAYKYCISQLEKYYPSYGYRTTGPYICNLLSEWGREHIVGYNSFNAEYYFPEFYTCKPTETRCGQNAWFGGADTHSVLVRLMVLQYCIEVCQY